MTDRTEAPALDDLRRAAFRAAKMLDRILVESDDLLIDTELAYTGGTDGDLARAVTAMVRRAESIRPGGAR